MRVDNPPEEHLLEHGHCGHDARLAPALQGVQLHVRRDQRGSKFSIGGCSSTAAADGLSDVVDLAIVLEVENRMLHEPGILTFSQFLSATMGPSVARVSAPRTIPSLKRHPTIVVPVLVALGNGRPLPVKKLFLVGR